VKIQATTLDKPSDTVPLVRLVLKLSAACVVPGLVRDQALETVGENITVVAGLRREQRN
jgi:hypothetical protein